MPIPGRHNVQNALAAIAVAIELGICDETIVAGFEKFEGVKRRFTKVGEADGAIIIDDYAHHPTEIRAVLVGCARGRGRACDRDHAAASLHAPPGLDGRLPERLQRCRRGVRDPVYAAGEEPIEGIDSAALADGLRAHGHRMVRAVGDLDELCETSAISPPKATS